MKIETKRKEIDTMDSLLLQLLEKRMNICKEIIHDKMAKGDTVVDKKREQEIIHRLVEKSTLPAETVEKIWTFILEESKHYAIPNKSYVEQQKIHEEIEKEKRKE